MRKVVPRPKVLLLNRKTALSLKQADFRDVFKEGLQGCPTAIIVVSPDPFSHTASTSSAMKLPENTEEESNDFEPVDNGDIQMDNSSDQLYSPSISSVTNKITCQKLGQYSYYLIIQI